MIIFFSHSFTSMVMGRFLQGLGTGCCAVLARASTRDRFGGAICRGDVLHRDGSVDYTFDCARN